MSVRSYRQNCALAHACDVVGERWTLLLLRDLLVAPRRFRDLTASLKGIGTNLLAERLKRLGQEGLIEKQRDVDDHAVYAATERGQALEPAILALVRWGLGHGPSGRADYHHRPDWDLLALKSVFQPDRARGLRCTALFRHDDFTGWIRLDNGNAYIGLGPIADPDLEIGGSVADVFTGPGKAEDRLESGSTALFERFQAAFALRN